MSGQSDYETLYGVGLLDDLHNYFPAILYDSARFHSVSELLTYIQHSARNRFDLFSFGQRGYHSRFPPQPVQMTSRQSALSALATSILSSPPSAPVQPAGPTHDLSGNVVESDTEEESEEEEEEITPPSVIRQDRVFEYVADRESDAAALQLVNLLLGSSMNLPLSSLRTRRINLDIGTDVLRLPQQFMEPVVVRATSEQIESGSTRAFPEENTLCSICQDAMHTNEMARRLNTCGHTFHIRCIDTWFEQNVHCPICRHDIRETNNSDTNSRNSS